MASRWAMVALLVAGLLLQQGTTSVNAANWYEVGGKFGWTFPPNGVGTFYNDWAKQYTFHVGDTLFFMYEFHTVLEVSQADYQKCIISSPLQSYLSAANASVTLDRTGYHAFICGEPSHCVGNMKLELTVLAPGQVAAPAQAPGSGAPGSGGPSSSAIPIPIPIPIVSGPAVGGPAGSQSHSGASVVQSLPSMIVGALLAVCGFLFL